MMKKNVTTKAQRHQEIIRLFLCVLVPWWLILLAWLPAEAWSGRRAVLQTRIDVMLAKNLPHKQQDCTRAMWRLLCELFPELRVQKWFRRTTAEVMAGWPWQALMRLDDHRFGDLLFTGRPKIGHVLMAYSESGTAVHAAKSRGFSKTSLKPHWWPKIEVAVRPPY
jgi:hypothetical protein